MSFSLKVKNELASVTDCSDCCRHAYYYGLLLFGRCFSVKDVSIMTDHKCVMQQYLQAVEYAGAKADEQVSKAGKYTVSVLDEADKKRLFSCFSVSGSEPVLRINRANLTNESQNHESEVINCCNAAFLRGAFMSCATVSDPNKNYHLEFVVAFRALSRDLLKIITEFGLNAKLTNRRGVYVIYIKDSDSIVDLIHLMGAKLSAFEYTDVKIIKSVRNKANRQTNFSYANIARTARAAYSQVSAIERLMKSPLFERLDETSKQIALLRVNNPDASLGELSQMTKQPMSRSAVNYRLKKLLDEYKKLEACEKPQSTEDKT